MQTLQPETCNLKLVTSFFNRRPYTFEEPMKLQLDRVFLRPQYALHYRRASRISWASAAPAEYVILVPRDGTLIGELDGDSFEIEERGALLLDPGATANASGQDAEYLSVTLSPSLMLDGAARTGLVGATAAVSFRTSVVEKDERLSRLAHDLSVELTQKAAGQEIVIAALIEQLIVHLLRQHSNVRRSDELELSRVGLVDRRIRRAIELMHAQLDRDLPLDEIAAAAFLSPFHFARLFKKSTGASPHSYLAGLRIARAQALLADTDLSVSEVGARVGYASSSHFTKAFRQSTGLAPRAYRAAVVSR